MDKVKILIVEDEIIIADHLADTLDELGYEVFEPAQNFEEAIAKIDEFKPDIAIIDINLKGKLTGIDLAAHINTEFHFPFIFLTSNTDKITIAEAKKVQPLAYLAKPFNRKELYSSIEVALYNYAEQRAKALDQESLIIKDALFVKENRIFKRLDFQDILFVKSDHVYAEVHMAGGQKTVVRSSLNEIQNKLSQKFFRANRSHIVNTDYILSVEPTELKLESLNLPIGKKQRDQLLQKLNI